ncbi:MAG: cation-translocating P-type ATPase [Pseudomonadota bacterium]
MGHGELSEKAAGFSGPWWKFPPLRNALVAGVLAGTAFLLEILGVLPETVAMWAYIVAIPVGGAHWMREGAEELFKHGEVGIEVLMIAATGGAAILGMWDEAAALVVLYGAAEGLEEFTYARTRTAIRALLDLAPKEARVLSASGEEKMVPAASLKPGDRFVVRPGESLPTDGKIVQGQSSLNESPVTGESVPVDKNPGDAVFAASINGEGALTIEVTKAFADNTLSRIIHMVETAQEEKGRAQKWIERFGKRYTPAVLIAAVLMICVPWLMGLPLEFWARRAVVLLVAAAPCALIMSLPMAMAAGIGAAGRRGILIKGGAHLEHLGIIKVVAFDKTGTLTAGKPVVTEVIPLGIEERALLAAAAGLEHNSQHPLARAIVDAAKERGIAPASAQDFRSLTGAGAQAVIEGVQWTVGSPKLFAERGSAMATHEARIAELQSHGKTVVLLALGNELRGLIAIQDQPRPEAKAAIAKLHSLGVKTAMLTGDNRRTGEAIARSLGIDDVRAELKPDDKVAAVKLLHTQYGPALMVGDGVNDAPALASATCGAAMGAAGTDAALEAADVALMKDDLMKVAEALARGKKARQVSQQNIVFSIAVLVAMIPLAVFGVIGVAVAVMVHEAAELLAVANGARAGRISAD